MHCCKSSTSSGLSYLDLHDSTAESYSSLQSEMQPAASPKAKRGRKKAEAATAASPAVSSALAASPVVSPNAKRARKKAEAAASPVASASPAKFDLSNLFKPKTSTGASPAAGKPAPAKGASSSNLARTGRRPWSCMGQH